LLAPLIGVSLVSLAALTALAGAEPLS